jgi:superoxide dismutase, Fe-Mn family
MSFELNPLPFDRAALEPVMSARTLELHHGKHHAGYVIKLNQLLLGTSLEKLHLETIVRSAARQAKQRDIYNNAAQIWNHDFFWKCLTPNGGGGPPDPVRKRIESKFHSIDNFRE